MTQIQIERPEQTGEPKQVKGRNWLLIFAVLVVVALAAFGIRAINDGSTTANEEEIQQLLDDYLQAWEDHDEAAARSMTTDIFVINEYVYLHRDIVGLTLDYHVNDDIGGVVTQGFGYNWTAEQVGDLLVTGEGPWFVSVEENWEERSSLLEGQANYTIVEVDGVLQIANHYWAGLRTF